MWMAYLVFLRRQIRWDQPHDKQLDAFREAAQQAVEFIDKCELICNFRSTVLYCISIFSLQLMHIPPPPKKKCPITSC